MRSILMYMSNLPDYQYRTYTAEEVVKDLGYLVENGGVVTRSEKPANTPQNVRKTILERVSHLILFHGDGVPLKDKNDDSTVERLRFESMLASLDGRRLSLGSPIPGGQLAPLSEGHFLTNPYAATTFLKDYFLVTAEMVNDPTIVGMVGLHDKVFSIVSPGVVEKVGKVDRLAVHEKHRGKGIGAALMDLAAAYLVRERGCSIVRTYPGTREGLNLVKRAGFVPSVTDAKEVSKGAEFYLPLERIEKLRKRA